MRYQVLLYTALVLVAGDVSAQHTVTVKVAMDYHLGGPQPIAHLPVQLLSESAEAVLRDVYDPAELPAKAAAPQPGAIVAVKPEGPELEGTVNMVEIYAAACIAKRSLCGPGYDALRKVSMARAQTDLSGTAVFEDVAPGVYWLLGWTTTRAGDAVYWNERVTVPSSRTTELSQANAVAIMETAD